MRRHRRLLLAAALAVAATVILWPRLPASAADALSAAQRFELISIDPDRSDVPSPDDFHRHRVLGRTTVTDPFIRARLAAALRHGVAPFYTSEPKCFSPRLGVRLTAADGRVTDLLVCFGCKQAQVWQDGRVVSTWITERSPAPAFEEAFRAAGVPRPADDD